jgi:tetratricopeptide (TPR) repeat protein
VAAYRKAIDLKPDFAWAYLSLGNALKAQGKPDEAAAAYRQAMRIDPNFAEAHCNFGHALREQGRLKDAREALRRGHALGSRRPGWPYPSARWVQQIDGLVALEEKLPAILGGEARAEGAAELLGLASVCGLTRRHAAASRFYADAFRADPKLADDLRAGHRYNAACSAALAAAGQGEDAAGLEEKERARLRKQAQEWLRADLDAWRRRVLDGNPCDRADAAASLRHWQGDADLVGVRHPWSLLRLPADERRQWRQLWTDVDELLTKAGRSGM